MKRAQKSRIRLRHVKPTRIRRFQQWWIRRDRRYGWLWRTGNGLAAVFLVASIALPILNEFYKAGQYKLSAATLSLVGATDKRLAKQLTYDSSKQLYQFNESAVKSQFNPKAPLANQVGTASGGKDKSLYALDVPQNLSQGVTYHDINSQLGFSLVPEFKSSQGQVVDGHLVYPLDGNAQAIYTLKNNGLKEDIVVPRVSSDTMQFSYQLKLPNTLEAKVIPNSGGAIGIYSADPSLFGDISYGSAADQAAVEKARINGAKTYLVFGLPAPVIKAPNGASVGNASARFKLNGNQLTVVAENLTDVKTPITIDPSVVVTSASDFQTGGNNEGNITFDTTNNQISRGGLTGGSLNGGWTDDSHYMSVVRQGAGNAVYDGRLYVYGGARAGNDWADVEYTTLNSNGSLSGWTQSANTFNTPRGWFGNGVYNGYLYVFGGYDGSGNALNDIQYAPINPTTGDIGAWVSNSTNLPGTRAGLTANFQNGYVYLTGGADASQVYDDVRYAPINADGSIGSWTTSSNHLLNTARQLQSSVVYNNNLYVLGGENLTETVDYNDVQYAHLNTDGSIGAFTAATSFTSPRAGLGAVAYGGYLYVMGGYDGSGNRFSDTQYAQINANGSIGPWATTASLINASGAAARWDMAAAAYNGYIYLIGGSESPPGNVQDDTAYAKIDPVGINGNYTTSGNTFTTTRRGAQEVAYNSYLYIMGGENASGPVRTVYKALINSDGSIGAFGADTSFSAAAGVRTFFAAVAYNGYMYILGGCSVTLSSCTTNTNNVATVYKSVINPLDGTLGSWSSTTAFTTARYGLSAVVYNGGMYVMGGLNGGTFENDVQYSAISASNGTLGSWTTSGATIPTAARAAFGATVYGGFLYIAGGCTAGTLLSCTTRQNDVRYIQLSSTGAGTVGTTWGTGSTFTNARYGMGLSAYNGYLYLTGGFDNTTEYSSTQYAALGSNGSVGTWATGTSIATGRYGIGMVAYDGFLYVSDGYDGSTYYNNVQYASINNGGPGTTGSWTTSGNSLPTAREWAGSAAYNGYLYVIGGANDNSLSPAAGTLLTDVEYAPLGTDGSVGSWSTTTSLAIANGGPGGLYGMGIVINNGYMYVVGGSTGSGGGDGFTYYNTINTNGTLGSAWTATGGAMQTATDGFNHNVDQVSAVAYNGYLYELGGIWCSNSCYSAQTQYAAINSNGTLGTWTAGNYMQETRADFVVAATNGYIYAVGDGSTGLTVEYAPLNANGSIGTWSYTSSLMYEVSSFTIGGIYNGYIYVLGSVLSGNTDSRDSFAAINSNGSLGPWQMTMTPESANAGDAAGAFYNGYVYMSGGQNDSGTQTTTVQYTSLNSIPRVARYSKLIDLSGGVNVSSITYNPSSLPGNSSVMYRTASSTGVFGSSLSAHALAGSTACTGNTTPTRYVWILVTLDDTTTATFLDANSTPANLTDFTINYNSVHPAPNIRLRTGQTLQNGSLSALDTCSP